MLFALIMSLVLLSVNSIPKTMGTKCYRKRKRSNVRCELLNALDANSLLCKTLKSDFQPTTLGLCVEASDHLVCASLFRQPVSCGSASFTVRCRIKSLATSLNTDNVSTAC